MKEMRDMAVAGLGPFVYFLAEAGIYSFSRSMAIFGGSLAQIGQRGFLTRCTGQLTRCAYLEMCNVPLGETAEAKARLCSQCNRHMDILSARYSLPVLSFSDFWTSDDALAVESNFDSLLAEPLCAVYDGVPVGKLAYKSLMLATKDAASVLTGERGRLFAEYLKTAIQSVVITRRIIRSVNPVAFIYGQIYAVEQASGIICRSSGVKASHHGVATLNGYDFGRLFVYSRPVTQIIMDWLRSWSACSHVPLTQEQVRSCWDDVYCRNHLSGNAHIYSPNKDGNLEAVRERFALAPHRQTLVLYTSSPDELDARKVIAEVEGIALNIVDLFADQADWLQSVCEYVAADENLQLVIRMHPRLGRDKRSGIASAYLPTLESRFASLPERCHIAWPQDSISSYDLAELADLVLTGWSSMGMELGRVGVPVIATMRNFAYPNDDFIQIPATQAEYFESISHTLQRRHTLQMLVKAIRFHYVTKELPTLDLREYIGSDLPDIHSDAKLFVGEKNAHLLRELFLEKIDLAEENLRAFVASQAGASEEDEVRTIAREICYFIHYSFFPPTHTQAASPSVWEKSLKPLIKRFAPVWIWRSGKACFHAVRDMFLPKIKPEIPKLTLGKKEVFPRPDFVFRLVPSFDSLERYKEMTSRDALLCIIARGPDSLFYIKGGVVKKTGSIMLMRLIDLFEDLPLSVKNDFALP